jgi:hypothetical protein
MAGGSCNKTLEISCVAPCSGRKYTAGTKDYRLGKASREWYVSAITEELSRVDETVTRSVPCFSVLILILRSSQNLGFQSTPALLKSSWGLRGRGQTKFVGHQDASRCIKHQASPPLLGAPFESLAVCNLTPALSEHVGSSSQYTQRGRPNLATK